MQINGTEIVKTAKTSRSAYFMIRRNNALVGYARIDEVDGMKRLTVSLEDRLPLQGKTYHATEDLALVQAEAAVIRVALSRR